MAKKTETTEATATEVTKPESISETPKTETTEATATEVTKPVLLDEAAPANLAVIGELVTVENELGVQHQVSATAAKSLLKDKKIKIIS